MSLRDYYKCFTQGIRFHGNCRATFMLNFNHGYELSSFYCMSGCPAINLLIILVISLKEISSQNKLKKVSFSGMVEFPKSQLPFIPCLYSTLQS